MESMDSRVSLVEQAQGGHERECALRYKHLVEGQEQMRQDLIRNRDSTEAALESINASLAVLNAAVAKRAGALAVIEWIGKAITTLVAGGMGALLAHSWGNAR